MFASVQPLYWMVEGLFWRGGQVTNRATVISSSAMYLGLRALIDMRVEETNALLEQSCVL